ncbi:hypothetical protein E1180_01730 [Roseibium denhamense]|uniref:DUF2938 family protein n=1 Tax=Roseibium denhamense TaxID=76305 RepID=A0ABY1PP67_9HYPH|nr:hypothetical protein [Roseibium denhamense]MTI04235.1 hypothetical protein [Roseibium denhamense]SMP37247.1 hypothetical protein SAMN06265374_0033 [Roseibium denhamense]
MTTLASHPSRRPLAASLPALSVDTLGLMFISGFFATIAFDLWGQLISPGLGFANLSPHGLAQSLLSSLGLPSNAFAGYFVHFYAVGLIGYPIGWMFVFAPLWQRTIGDTHWVLPAALYGAGLWVFAIGGITAIAGLPFFLNFTGITWVALVGHVLYAIVLVGVLRAIDRQKRA